MCTYHIIIQDGHRGEVRLDLQTWSGSSINLLTLLSKVLFKLDVVYRPIICPQVPFLRKRKGLVCTVCICAIFLETQAIHIFVTV